MSKRGANCQRTRGIYENTKIQQKKKKRTTSYVTLYLVNKKHTTKNKPKGPKGILKMRQNAKDTRSPDASKISYYIYV